MTGQSGVKIDVSELWDEGTESEKIVGYSPGTIVVFLVDWCLFVKKVIRRDHFYTFSNVVFVGGLFGKVYRWFLFGRFCGIPLEVC